MPCVACAAETRCYTPHSEVQENMNEIIHGNHLDVLKRYPDGCFDMFLTSPPYDDLREYKGYTFKFEPLAHELYRVLKDGGVGVWVVNDATVNGSETLTSFKQAIYFKDVVGFNVHDTMAYCKDGLAFPNSNRYYQTFEYMFVLSKGNLKAANLLRKITTHKNNSAARSRQKDGSLQRIKYDVGKETRVLGNVWKYGIGNGKSTLDKIAFKHPAIFPEKLAEDHILSWSNPGDVILDPMCGSGTTCKMAAKHQRQYVGIDCSETYCELARTRLERFTTQTTIFDTVSDTRENADV